MAFGEQQGGRLIDRRTILKSTAVLGASSVVFGGAARGWANGAGRSRLMYVGTYSSPEGPEGAKGRGEGIYLFEMSPETGELTQRALFKNAENPSWLVLNSARTHLFSANETTKYEGAESGSVSSYAVERPSGKLALVTTVSSEGAGPAHLSVHPSQKHVLVANYHGGTVAVLPIDANGALSPATDVKRFEGAVGPEKATSAPRGSFAISGHDKPHAHMVQADASGKFVFAADLGRDRIVCWKFDSQSGKLTEHEPGCVTLPAGDGPRHFAFHPSGKWFYSLQEESSTLAVFEYEAQAGRLTAKATVSTLPKGFAGTDFTSEILISADGKFLYVGNRLHDSIACFSLADGGAPKLLGEEWTRGDYPRSFTIDPSGKFLYSCNQRADAIATFRVNRETGSLTFTGQYTPVGTPAIVVFLD